MTTRRELERSGTRNPALVRMESRTASLARGFGDRTAALEASPLANGVLLRDIRLTSTAQDIEHGLGRAWTGAIITKSATPLSLATTSTQTDAKWIGLATDTTDVSGSLVDVVVF